MKKIYSFGVSTVYVNNQPIYTFRIRCKKSDFNRKVINHFGLRLEESSGKYLVTSETYLDSEFFNQRVALLGKVLRYIAINNLKQKYSWVNQ